MPKVLYNYQEEAVQNIRDSFGKNDAVCFTLPTGGGKTVIFSYIAEQTQIRGKNVLIIAHRDFLLEQISMSLADNGVEHNLICQNMLKSMLYLRQLREYNRVFLNTKANVIVAGIMSLTRKDLQHILSKIDLIIVDEAHRSCAAGYLKVFKSRKPGCKILGVSASPQRTDGQGLDTVYQDLVCGPPLSELIKRQKLCYPIVYAPQHQLDLSGVQTIAGDYNLEQLYKAVSNDRKIVGDSIEHYKNISGILPALGFCVNVKHAEQTAEEYRAAGIKAIALSAKNSSQERQKATFDLKNRDIDVIFSCDLFNEGYDVPLVAVAIKLRPTKSLIIDVQQNGRPLRRYLPDMHWADMQHLIKPNGDHIAYIFDHAGNTMRHGLPTDERNWTLKGKAKRAKSEAAPRVSTCPHCFSYHSVGKSVCPHCGYVYPKQSANTTVPDIEEGELKVVNAYMPEWADGLNIKEAPLKEVLELATSENLPEIAKVRGYDKRWIGRVEEAWQNKPIDNGE